MQSIASNRRGRILSATAIVVFLIAAGFSLAVQVSAPPAAPQIGDLTYVSIDKPIYRTGEKLYVRGVILRADDHTPVISTQGSAGLVSYQIKGPKGDTVASGTSPITDSVVGFAWDIPAGQPGGEYIVRVSNPSGAATAERKFDIRAYRAPRLKSQIAFVRDGYGPGDTVTANLHVERAEGGIPAGAKVSISARIDGSIAWTGSAAVDASGNAGTSFKLPAAIERGEGVLALTIQDGGTVETATKTIPILLQTVDLAIYPEGGDLVAGLTNRVYIEARTPSKKPADLAGFITDTAGREVAKFRTEHEGRGRFTFVPEKDEAYSLHVTEPAGIKTIFPLPTIKEAGVVMASNSDVTARRKDVVIRVAATTEGEYSIALTQHGKELTFKSVNLRANRPTTVSFTVPRTMDGVIVATVYDTHMTPVAERLLFRQPERSVKVQIAPDRPDYIPGEKVTLRVATTDDAGNPVGAMVGLTVTDSSVLEMIEKREQAPQLPVMVLLESDVKDLADAHVYLDESNPKAPLATDLLLGTQGWRRFATFDTAQFEKTHGDAARRVLAVRRQGNGSLGGTVLDTTKALIPGVTVTLTNVNTGVSDTRVTNDSGSFSFSSVPAGTYRLTGNLSGFRQSVIAAIPVGTSAQVRADLTLQIGQFGQTVTVHESSASVGEVLEADRIRTLPLVGGNVLDLLTVLPGFRESQGGKPFDTVGGLGLDTVNTTINGMTTNSSRNSAEVYGFQVFTPMVTNPDLVGEIRLIVAPVDLELGRGAARGAAGGGGRMGNTPAPSAPKLVTVREYAHALQPDRSEDSRTDFSETVYWNSGVKTDSATGIATVSFHLSDAVTSFRVLADAFSDRGALGSSVAEVESVKPFSIEPKIPLQVTSGDVIELPIGVVNGMNRELRGAKITANDVSGIRYTMPGESVSSLNPKERSRQLVKLEVGDNFKGLANLTFDAKAGGYRDTVSRTLDVQPLGFPHELSAGGLLESNGSKTLDFTLPNEIVLGSISSSITVYPTPLASMTDALKALLQQPYGCFEQTSSTSYPMVMAQQYFLTHTGVDAGIIEKTKGLLEASYKRLTGFESPSKGYEWFGADPGHDALTAYGLLQFTDMSQVRNVDTEMVTRTRKWLLARRDGKGGFTPSSVKSHAFGYSPEATGNAYITWALLESGEKGLEKEIAAVKASAETSQDSYIVALGANILSATGDRAGAIQLMDKLAKNQEAAGNVKGAVTSITNSGGNSLAIETTALSVLAWLNDPQHAVNVEKGIRWIGELNQNGRFGSTQSTILALRAIVAYDKANARAKAPGSLILTVDGKQVGAPVAFTADSKGALTMPELGSELGRGKHTVVLRMEGGSRMPYSFSVKFHSNLPESDSKAQVGIEVVLKDGQIQEGGVTEAIVSIANKSDQAIPTPVAIVGIPGGLEVRHDQLKELVKSGRIASYEINGREVVLYWRSLNGLDNFDIPLSLVAAVPGTYTGPASRAYLYYTDEYKSWAPGLKVNITPLR